MGWRRRLAVLVGFAGAAFAIQPTGDAFRWVMLGRVIVAFLSASRDLLIRRSATREISVSLLTYSNVAVTLIALRTLPIGWDPLSLGDFVLLAVTGKGVGIGVDFLTDAIRYGDASLLSHFKYSAIVQALVFAFLVWDEVPDDTVWPGALLVVGSGIYILHWEGKPTHS